MLPSDPTYALRSGRPSRTRSGKFNARPRSGTLAEQGTSGKAQPVPPAWMVKPKKPLDTGGKR